MEKLNLILILLTLTMFSCKREHKNHEKLYHDFDKMEIFTGTDVKILTDGVVTRNYDKTKIIYNSRIVTILAEGDFHGTIVLSKQGKVTHDFTFSGFKKLTYKK